MHSSSTIVISSSNQDFAEELSEILQREFSANCKIGAAAENGDLLITDNELDGLSNDILLVRLPVSLRSLLAEIEQRLKNTSKNDILPVAENLKLSLQNKILSNDAGDIQIDLTDKETQILQMLVEKGDSVISRDELLKIVWGIENELDTHTLETHIYRLRKKIRDAFGVEIIKAIDGGYRV